MIAEKFSHYSKIILLSLFPVYTITAQVIPPYPTLMIKDQTLEGYEINPVGSIYTLLRDTNQDYCPWRSNPRSKDTYQLEAISYRIPNGTDQARRLLTITYTITNSVRN